MDLEKLEQSWSAISKQLAEQEIINRKILKEIISKKAETAHDKLHKRNVINLLNIILGGIVLAVINNLDEGKLETSTFIMVETYIAIGFVYHVYMLHVIRGFNVAVMNVSAMMKQVLRYKRLYAFNFRTGIPAGIFVIALVFIANNAVTVLTISLTILFLLLALFIGYLQHRRHKKYLVEIEQGLQELREFESETE